MKKLLSALLLLIFTTSAMAVAIFPPRPIAVIGSYNMELSQATRNFEFYDTGSVQLYKMMNSNTYTDISFRLQGDDLFTDLYKKLPITSIENAPCGKIYHANYMDNLTQERFHVSLTDFNGTTCKKEYKYLWKVRITHGIGFCGTGDDHVVLQGDPEPLYHIM